VVRFFPVLGKFDRVETRRADLANCGGVLCVLWEAGVACVPMIRRDPLLEVVPPSPLV